MAMISITLCHFAQLGALSKDAVDCPVFARAVKKFLNVLHEVDDIEEGCKFVRTLLKLEETSAIA